MKYLMLPFDNLTRLKTGFVIFGRILASDWIFMSVFTVRPDPDSFVKFLLCHKVLTIKIFSEFPDNGWIKMSGA